MRRFKLLIVDDNPDNLRVIEALLNQHLPECEAISTHSSQQALVIADRETIDAALIDFQMPILDGVEVCRRLKASPRTRHIPVVLITAHSSTPQRRAQALEAGADDFVSRPIDNVELAARIRVMFRIRQAEEELRAMNANLQQLVDEQTRTLRESEERYRSLFTRTLEGVALHEMICDERGQPVDYRFLEINPAFEHLTGLSADRAIGRTVRELLPTEADRWVELYGKVALAGEALHFEQYSEALGKWFEIAAFCPRRDQFACVFNDITERHRAAQAMEKLNQQLEDKNKELGSIIYATSHDLRSPLINLQGFSHELDQSCKNLIHLLSEAALSPEVREQIEPILRHEIPQAVRYILTGTVKMDALLTGLLRLSRLGRAELHIRKLDMDELLASVRHSMGYQIKSSGAVLEIEPLPPCTADATQVNQIFSNLIDNALKYLDPDRPGVVKVCGREDTTCRGYVVYEVRDNGIGIHRDHHQRIFDLFHRLNPRGPIPGDGLGLTTVHRAVERQGGQVWLESQPGEGSTFYVALPASRGAAGPELATGPVDAAHAEPLG